MSKGGEPLAEATQWQAGEKDRGLTTWPLTRIASGAFKKQYALRWDPSQVHLDGRAGEVEKVSFPAEETSGVAEERKTQEILAALILLSS